MSLLNNFFSNLNKENQNSRIEWKPLTHLDHLNEVISISNKKPVLLFKHSTRCSISRFALKNFENNYNLDDKIELYYLDLLNYREISNEIASRFEVQHQSPQIILVKNGKAVFSSTHDMIQVEDLMRFI